MRPLPFHQPGAGIPFFVLLAVFVLGEQRIRVGSWRNQAGRREDRFSLPVVIVLVAGGIVGAVLLANHATWAAIGVGRWAFFVAGLVLMAAGIALRHWAVILLGTSFTVDVRVQENQPIVDRGPYRCIRHPSYSGMILVFLGLGLALDNWSSLLVLLVVPTVGLIIRIRVEEDVLLTELGEPYREFASRRARLIPFVW